MLQYAVEMWTRALGEKTSLVCDFKSELYLQLFHLSANVHDGENSDDIQIDSFGKILIKLDGCSAVVDNTDFFVKSSTMS